MDLAGRGSDWLISIVYIVLFASLVSFTFLKVLIHLAPRLNLMDEPGGHRQHEDKTPLVGGLAIFCSFLITVLWTDVPLSGLRALFAGSVLLVIIGVLDDMHELSTRWRFIPQIIAALGACLWADILLVDLGKLFGDSVLYLGRWSIALTVFSMVGVINALNMIDGTDGQSGSILLIAFAALAWVAASTGYQQLSILIAILVIVAVFLAFNFPFSENSRARTFMGDTGSMFLGFLLCWYLIVMSQGETRQITPVTALWLVSIPLIDTVSVMLRRMALGHSPFVADRTHIHHLLPTFGFSRRKSLLIVIILTLAGALYGLYALQANIAESFQFTVFMAFFVGYFVVTFFIVRQKGLHLDSTDKTERRQAERRQTERRTGLERRNKKGPGRGL